METFKWRRDFAIDFIDDSRTIGREIQITYEDMEKQIVAVHVEESDDTMQWYLFTFIDGEDMVQLVTRKYL